VRFLLICTWHLPAGGGWSECLIKSASFRAELADGWEGRDMRGKVGKTDRDEAVQKDSTGTTSCKTYRVLSVADIFLADCRRDCFEISV
jgi:hypothetical protein